MNQMVTVCPNCRQQLAVTPADLRVGQGFVRCGRCEKVFNALLTLAADAPVPSEPSAVAHGTGSMPALDEQEILPPLPGREQEIGEFELVDEDLEVTSTHTTGQFRGLVLEGDEALVDIEEPMPDVGVQDQLARDIIRQATSQPIDMLLSETDSEPPPPPPPPPRAAAPRPHPYPPPPPLEEPPPPEDDFDADELLGNARVHRGWYAAAVVLVLALTAQWIHHNRHSLLGVSWLARPLQSVYGLFGQQLEPLWDLGWYEVQQLGDPGFADDNKTLVVRAAVAVKKDAPWGQPPPLMRVVLSDKYGNVLAKQELHPRDWLLGEAPARIEAGQRRDAEISVPAPERVSGIALHPCLPDSSGAMRCTDDPLP